jgi:hypothetical protein
MARKRKVGHKGSHKGVKIHPAHALGKKMKKSRRKRG